MSFLSSQSLGIYKGGFHWTHPSRHFKRPSPEFTSMEDDCTKKAMYGKFPLAFFFGVYRKKITKLINSHVLMYLSCVYRFIIVLNLLQPFGDIRHAISWFGLHRASSFLVVSWLLIGSIFQQLRKANLQNFWCRGGSKTNQSKISYIMEKRIKKWRYSLLRMQKRKQEQVMIVCPPRAVAEILLRQITNRIPKKKRESLRSVESAYHFQRRFAGDKSSNHKRVENNSFLNVLVKFPHCFIHPPDFQRTVGEHPLFALKEHELFGDPKVVLLLYPRKGVGCCVHPWVLEASVISAKMFNDISNWSLLQAVLKTDTNRPVSTTKPFGQGTLESALSRSSGSSSKPNSSISSLGRVSLARSKGISDRSFESEGWGVIWKCP